MPKNELGSDTDEFVVKHMAMRDNEPLPHGTRILAELGEQEITSALVVAAVSEYLLKGLVGPYLEGYLLPDTDGYEGGGDDDFVVQAEEVDESRRLPYINHLNKRALIALLAENGVDAARLAIQRIPRQK